MVQSNCRLRGVMSVLLFVGAIFILSLSVMLAQASSPEEEPGLTAIVTHVTSDDPQFVPGVVLIQFDDDVMTSRAYDLAASLPGAQRAEALASAAGIYRITVEIGSERALAAEWMQDPRVRMAEPDFIFYTTATPNDSLYGRYQWNLRQIRADQAWDRTTGSSHVVIAIIDTGVDLTHPDLVDKIVPGYDLLHNDADPADDQGHGTHVASIAAASSNNEQGIAGVAWGARIMPIKVLDANGVGRSSTIAQGISWAVDQGAHIINLSLGGSNYSDTVARAIYDAHQRGVLVIAAAGNHYRRGNPVIYPAAYNHVLAVAATTDTDGHASYSSSGSYVDVAAPGGDPGSANDRDSRHWIPGAYWRGSGMSYVWLSGSSQAAPHVSGLAALLLSINASLTPDQLSAIITGAAVDVQLPGWDEFSGHGRIDVSAALDAVQTLAANTPTPTPSWTATPTATPSPTPLPPALLRPRQDRRINSVVTNHQADAVVVADHKGNLTSLWHDGRNGNDALYSAHLNATGKDWSANLLVVGTQQRNALDVISPPALATEKNGTIHAIWHSQNGSDSASIFYSAQAQAGSAWTLPLRIDHDDIAANRTHPVLAVADDGTLTAVWEDERNAAKSEIYWSERKPGSSEWSTPALIYALGVGDQREATLAIGTTGVYIAWVSRNGETATLVVAHKRLSAPIWSTPQITLPLNPTVERYGPALIVDANEVATLAWSDQRTAETGLDIFTIQQRKGQEQWSSPARVNDDYGSSDQRHPRLAASAHGLAIVWEDMRSGDPDIFMTWQMPDSAAWSPNHRANQDEAGIIQRGPDVAMDANGHTTVVWTDYRTGNTAPEIYTRFIPLGERFSIYLPRVATSERRE
ncbi:MAG: S8 family serine peptidase [Caldilineaceae bacterium]|nr:S8 family serine peptidase [Caldilineaceae bacterium]